MWIYDECWDMRFHWVPAIGFHNANDISDGLPIAEKAARILDLICNFPRFERAASNQRLYHLWETICLTSSFLHRFIDSFIHRVSQSYPGIFNVCHLLGLFSLTDRFLGLSRNLFVNSKSIHLWGSLSLNRCHRFPRRKKSHSGVNLLEFKGPPMMTWKPSFLQKRVSLASRGPSVLTNRPKAATTMNLVVWAAVDCELIS